MSDPDSQSQKECVHQVDDLHLSSSSLIQHPHTQGFSISKNYQRPNKSRWIKLPSTAQLSMLLVLAASLIPLIALIIWMSRRHVEGASYHSIFDSFAGEVIGGSMTQSQAKAVDVISGALLAPLVIACFNTVLFDNARVSVVNEKRQKAIPLRSLITASQTSSGSYNLINLRSLIRGRTWRLFLLAIITVLTALAKSAFSNIIAYEAFRTEEEFAPSVLRLQTDVDNNWANISYNKGFDFTQSQQVELASQMSAMLISLPSRDMGAYLTDSTYVAGNVTQKSLDKLPGSIVKLKNVPGYRLSIDCQIAVPTRMLVQDIASSTAGITQIMAFFNETKDAEGYSTSMMTATYPGSASEITYDVDRQVTFPAFTLNATEFYLGLLHIPYVLPNNSGPSTSYGNAEYSVLRWNDIMLPTNSDSLNRSVTISGLHCSMYREEGLLDYIRFNSSSAVSQWNISDFNPSKDGGKKVVPSFISLYQGTNLNFRFPGGLKAGGGHSGEVNPGLGPAFVSKNWAVDTGMFYDQFALRFLYGSAEAQRITYEVAAMNDTESRNPPEFFVKVESAAAVERYRITVVPSLLLLGLTTLILAGVVTAAMLVYTWRTTSAQSFRCVDEVRILVDGAINLRDNIDGNDMLELAKCSNSDIDRWATKYKVRYAKSEDEMTTILLRRG